MITLASDFGTPYPAAMRGVILQRSDARLVDVTHDLPRQDVRAAAFWLRELLPWFPPAVHLVVVDPGVGTDRNALLLRVGEHALVAPDNGVAAPVARELDGEVEAFRIDDADALSSTFHGRDVFAPAAADVHEAGVDAAEELDHIEPDPEFSDLRLPDPQVDEENRRAVGEVLVVDDFGNAITNLPGSLVVELDSVRVDAGTTDDERIQVGETFESVPRGDRVVTVGSHGNLELDVNHGRGDESFGIAPGDDVVLQW
jgi:S-adenosylmethionine hydrolase